MLKSKFHSAKYRCFNIFVLFLAAVFLITGCSDTEKTTASISTTASSATSATTASTAQTSAATTHPIYPEPTKKVALTFDDGPHRKYTAGIADELEKHGFHATFFVVGNRTDGTAYNCGNAIERLIEGGHEIAIHGYTHTVYYDNCTDEEYSEEINKTAEAIRIYSPDYEAKLVRPIGGRISQERLDSSPHSFILWNLDSDDWKYKYIAEDGEQEKAAKVETIVKNVMSKVQDGSIILMHDIYESTYDAVKVIIPLLRAEGYEIVTVSELLGDTLPGTKYPQR